MKGEKNMNSWKEYEDNKKAKAISTLILSIFFSVIIWALIAAVLQFIYNSIASTQGWAQLSYWIFFWGWFAFGCIIKIIKKG